MIISDLCFSENSNCRDRERAKIKCQPCGDIAETICDIIIIFINFLCTPVPLRESLIMWWNCRNNLNIKFN